MNRYESKKFTSELARQQISVNCLSRFMACQALLSRKHVIQRVPFELSKKISLSIYDMVQADSVTEEIFFGISDLAERIQEIVDTQIMIFNEKSVIAFKGLHFLSDNDYDVAGAPYRAEFTCNIFNLIQCKVAQELSLRNVDTGIVSFDLNAYLMFLSEKGITLKSLEERNESMIFEWSEYACYVDAI